MKTTQVLTSTVVLSSIFLGTVATAEAATLTKSYFVESALKNAERYSNSADHFGNLGSIVGYGQDVKDYVQSGNVILDVYDNGTARFYGTIEQKQDSSKKFQIDVLFTNREGYAGQAVKKGKSLDHEKLNWDFYDIDASSKLIGLGANAHLGEIFIEDASGGTYLMQLGLGANDKNSNFGFSTWFREQGTTSGHSDFNVDLIARSLPPSEPVPEPTMGLALAGLAGAGVLRRKQKAASK